MEIQVLGSGSAFTLANFQTSFLINNELLFDCGSDTRFALHKIGASYKDIENVFISHLHSDHVGGLEWLGFARYFDPSTNKPNLYISESLIDALWDNVLKGGMGSLQGKIATIDTYFNIEPIGPNGVFDLKKSRLECKPVQTIHIMNGFWFVPSYGLMVRDVHNTDKTVFFTGDTQYAPAQISDFYRMADTIIHDCEYMYDSNGKPIMSKVHSHYCELLNLPEQVRNKMYLVHYQDAMLGKDVCVDGFLGMLNKGDVLFI